MRDPRAALENSRAGLAVARRLGTRGWVPGFVGNIGEFGLRTGDWAEAIADLSATLNEEFEPTDRQLMLNILVQLRTVRGDSIEQEFAESQALIGDGGDVQVRSNLAMTRALRSFATGDLAGAIADWRLAGSHAGSVPVARARSARAALWARDVEAAREDLAAIDGSAVHGAAIDADRTTIRAGIAALEGRASEALGLYRESLRGWRDLRLAWDQALCAMDMALLLGSDEPEVRAEVATGARHPRSSRGRPVHRPPRPGDGWLIGADPAGRFNAIDGGDRRRRVDPLTIRVRRRGLTRLAAMWFLLLAAIPASCASNPEPTPSASASTPAASGRSMCSGSVPFVETNLSGGPADALERLGSTYQNDAGFRAVVFDGARVIVVVEPDALPDWQARLAPGGVAVARSCVAPGLIDVVDRAMARMVGPSGLIVSWGYDALKDAVMVQGVDQDALVAAIGQISDAGRRAAIEAISDGTLRVDPRGIPNALSP